MQQPLRTCGVDAGPGTALCVGSCNRKACKRCNRGVGPSARRMIDSCCPGHCNASNESNTSVMTPGIGLSEKNAATPAVRKIPTRFGQVCKRSNQQRLLRERNFRPSLDWAAVSKLAISAQGLRKVTPTTSGASQSLAHLVTLGFCLGLVEAILIRLTHSGSDLCYDFAGWLTCLQAPR